MDQLSSILQRFSMNTEVFFTGNLCGISHLDKQDSQGHLHLLRSGELTIIDEQGKSLLFNQPTVLFVPLPHAHRIVGSVENPPQLVCAKVVYDQTQSNPIANSLPHLLHFNFNDCPNINKTAQWLFEEAFQDKCGRLPMLSALTDIFIIHILRFVLSNKLMEHGLLAGLAHPQLAKVLVAIQAKPEYSWGLQEMADIALMSRSKFADLFKRVVGQSPGDYLVDWRISVAKTLLKENKSVALVANSVGYENGSALARIFRKKLGLSPKEWLLSIQ
ncbi:AraC family transcriptional regulator [Psychromonas sp. KJ10-2]|uniref:AraC family transcriptional regulator n=1 Tax=Psychromonas sp. KJ10-2 TaxID=3391822 RepID=UPI0039B5B220